LQDDQPIFKNESKKLLNEAPLGILFSTLVVLIFLSAFFSSSETGMMTINRYRLKHLFQKGHKGATRVTSLLEKPDRLIGLILIGNNLVNIFATTITTIIAMRLYGDIGLAVAPVILTLIILIFAEVTPKTIAAIHPEKIAYPASFVLKPLMSILYPAVWLANYLSNGILAMFGIRHTKHDNSDHLNADELRTVVNEAGAMIPARHQHMLLNILDLEHAEVDDIMIPRNEIYGIDLNESDEDIAEKLQACEYNRVVVYHEDINNVQGVLHLRNVARVFDGNGLNRELLMEEIREPYFVPEGTPLHTQLFKFQELKHRFAIIVDEYGVVQGIATLEDILEEIVGEFTSNISDNIEEVFPQADGSYIIDGTATIRDINKNLGWELPTDGPKTINGLILEHLESFPEASVSIRIDHYSFEIIELSDNIIQTVRANDLDEI
jgi:Mg2+/Co2+ transporter CorB